MRILPEPHPVLPPQQLLDFLPPVNEDVCVHFSGSDPHQNVAISCETHPPGVWPPTGRHLAPHLLPADLCIAPIPDIG